MEHLKAKYGPAAVARFDAADNPLDRAAGKVGISFNKQRRIIRTGDSHRLVEWCKATQPQTVDPLMETLFKAYFEDARDLSRREELVACAASHSSSCTRRAATASRWPSLARSRARSSPRCWPSRRRREEVGGEP